MNFDAFWQTHRRFILGLGGGIIAFFILLAITGGGPAEDFKRSSSNIARTKRQLKTGEMYGSAEVSALEERLNSLRERNEQLGKQILPPFRPRFQIPSGTPAAQHYIGLTGELRDEILGWALRRNCDVDETLGLPPVSPSQPQQIERILHGLDVVDRAVHIAVESGAAEVDKIRIAQKGRRRSGRNASTLDLTPVTMEVVFRRVSATPFLRSLAAEQASGNPLGLSAVEVLPRNARRMEQRVLLEFSTGILPQTTPEVDLP